MGKVVWTSEEMLERLRKEEEAKELLRRCREIMGKLVWDKTVRSEDLAEELVLKLLGMGEEGRKNLGNKAWLWEVARNTRNDHARKLATARRGGGRRHEQLQEEIPDSQPSPHELVEARLDTDSFCDQLRTELSDKEWGLFDLRWQHPDAPYVWLAAQLGTNERAARSMWVRILGKVERAKDEVWQTYYQKFLNEVSACSAAVFLARSEGCQEGDTSYVVAQELNWRADPWTLGHGVVGGFEDMLDMVRVAKQHAEHSALLARCPYTLGTALVMQAEAIHLAGRHGGEKRRGKARELAVEGWNLAKGQLRERQMWDNIDHLAHLCVRLGLVDQCRQALDFGIEGAQEIAEGSEVAVLTEFKVNLAEHSADPW